MRRIQLVGTQRTGSNVLRLMLGQLDGVFAPPSVHLIEAFRPIAHTYGNLKELASRAAMLNDMLELIRVNALAWPKGPPDPSLVEDLLVEPSTEGLFVAIHDAGAAENGSGAWVNKCLENLAVMEELHRVDPDLHFVHLVRDGRDVVLSLLRAPIGPEHPLVAARKWRDEQRAVRVFAEEHPDTVDVVRYEDLLREPMVVLQRLCALLGVPPSLKALDFHRSAGAREAVGKSDLWMNLASPLNAGNTGKYRNAANEDVVRAVERVAVGELAAYGYAPLHVTAEDLPSQDEWRAAEEADRKGREARRAAADAQTEIHHEAYEAFRARLRAR